MLFTRRVTDTSSIHALSSPAPPVARPTEVGYDPAIAVGPAQVRSLMGEVT